ncbi:hypothetical protein F5B19DRAFT_60960 [Rostrohypoxylon terebratum]|nr:hypothetical protein F5B19DRAFT_60960 [Rostrohypoxylon terebratum]
MDTTHTPPALHHRMPIVFGPFPGPRQSFDGNRRDGSASTNREAFLTFTTPKSKLISLLPPGFSFQDTPATSVCAYVTVAPKRLDNLEWLGYRGYNLFSFFIHGVQYTSPNGVVRKGTYLPVLWEDMADPIISGREELGFPKLFADISIHETQGQYQMSASWMGSRFVDFKLEGLHEVESYAAPLAPKEAGVDEGTLLWRHMPTPGQPGIKEVDYPVFVSHAEERKIQPVTTIRRYVGTSGELKWHPLDWQSLPTLHHIIKQLADIHITEIVQCGLTEKVGNSDLSSAKNANI